MLYDGPQSSKLLGDKHFPLSMNEVEKDAWDAFVKMINRFLGNTKAYALVENVSKLIDNLHKLSINMSINVHFLLGHL